MMNKIALQQIADRISRQARRLGYDVDEHRAQTNTLYLSCDHPNAAGQIKIRIADHGECYCSEDISIDPDGCEMFQAIALLARRAGRKIPQPYRRQIEAYETERAQHIMGRLWNAHAKIVEGIDFYNREKWEKILEHLIF